MTSCSLSLTRVMLDSLQYRLEEVVTGGTEQTTLTIIIIASNISVLFLPIILWIAQEDVIDRSWRFFVTTTGLRRCLSQMVSSRVARSLALAADDFDTGGKARSRKDPRGSSELHALPVQDHRS